MNMCFLTGSASRSRILVLLAQSTYYLADHLGSTRAVTNSSGAACYEADFLPYGTENTPASFSDTCSTNYKFTGYERDPETAGGTSSGNDYAFARYYNSRMGRFLSKRSFSMAMSPIRNP